MTPKPHHLADFKRAKRRIKLIMAYLYLPYSEIGSFYSKRFKKNDFDTLLKNLL